MSMWRMFCDEATENAEHHRRRLMTDPVYVWRCTDGHETAHSDVEIRSLTVTPRCTMLLPDGSRCWKRLVKRVREHS